METLCGETSGSDWWDNCHVDLINMACTSCMGYFVLLIFVYMKCTDVNRNNEPTGIQQQDGQRRHQQLFANHTTRSLLSIALALLHMCELADALLSRPISVSDVLVGTASLLAWPFAIGLYIHAEHTRKPRLLWATATLHVVTASVRAIRLATVIQRLPETYYNLVRFYSTSGVVGVSTLLAVIDLQTIYAESCTKSYILQDDQSNHRVTYLYSEASFFSKATFWWLTPLLRVGYREPLEIVDLGTLPDEETVAAQFISFNEIYCREKKNLEKKIGTKLSLWKCYFLFCWRNFLLGGILKLIGDFMGLVGPLSISMIIDYVAHPPQQQTGLTRVDIFVANGYVIGAAMFVAAIAQGTLSQGSTHLVNVEGIHLKAALQGLIYDKLFKLTSWTLKDKMEGQNDDNKKKSLSMDNNLKNGSSDSGNIVNLIVEDAFNIMSFIWIGHYIWAIPLKIGVLIYLLYLTLGTSAVIGALFCIATMTPLQFFIGKKMSTNSKHISEMSDERLRKINETLQGIKLVKLLAWENLHEQRVQEIRQKELVFLDKDSLFWALMMFLTHVSSVIVTLMTFGIYSLIENEPLTSSKVFTGLALFNQLTVPLFIFPVTVPIIINAIVSTRRLEEYFSQPEIKNIIPTSYKNDCKKMQMNRASDLEPHIPLEDCSRHAFGLNYIDENDEEQQNHAGGNASGSRPQSDAKVNNEDEPSDDDNNQTNTTTNFIVVRVDNGKFSWGMSNEFQLVLEKLEIPKGKLTLVIGKVGSGKTSLVSAILGEMHLLQGKVKWLSDASIAYVAQNSWLLNTTLRDNILFGEPYRPRRYNRVLTACALHPDLELLPGGDMTEIGEKGINLSGGQKQRIAIARALYSKANVVIMDDPLSALDYQVVRHVFENGIQKMLSRQKRTAILITHRLRLLRTAHHVIVMDKGRIRAQGSFQDLQLTSPYLIKEWHNVASHDSPDEGSGRTARERWSLFRLVSRIGLKLRLRNSIHGSWTTEEETHVTPPPYRPLRRRLSSTYGSRYFVHDLLLPTDECDDDEIDEESILNRFSRRSFIAANWADDDRKWKSSSMRLHRLASKAISLQTSRKKSTAVAVRRQLSSPSIQHEPLCVTDSGPSHMKIIQKPDEQTGIFKRLFSGSQKSINGTLSGSVKEKNFLRRLISSSSVRSTVAEEKIPVNRLLSTESVASEDDEIEYYVDGFEVYKLSSEEERIYGKISKRVLWTYAKAGGIIVGFGYLGTAMAWQATQVYTDYQLTEWTQNNKTENHRTSEDYLMVYMLLSLISVLLSLASKCLGQYSGAIARRRLHHNLIHSLLHCPMYFFETTPIGRIINRFSSDMVVIDKKLATSIQRLVQFLFLCFSAILVNAYVTPWFLVIAIPICITYYIIQKFYRCSSRELQRLDSITRSPVLSHFSETLGGLPTIRAYCQQDRFTQAMRKKMDMHLCAFLTLNTSNRWLGIMLDYLGGVIVLMAVMASLISAHYYPTIITPALMGFAINYTLLVPIYLTWVVKFLADVEMYLNAVERVHYYSGVPTEDYKDQDLEKYKQWPKTGEILFETVSLSYNNKKDPVIKNMNLLIPSGQKIGICGRTGSGKSSLILSLFGMIDVCEGRIIIDNVDMKQLPLRLLRSRIAIIPQDVLMFSGTLRNNLDPYLRFTDIQLWHSLELVQLKGVVSKMAGGLDMEVSEGGSNFSSGERQLLCLARAFLHQTTILVMDEGTSSVDPVTEQAVLLSAKQIFHNRTVIIVAHRLETIMDCDRIIVLDEGKIVEDGNPRHLKDNISSIFYGMLHSTSQQ